MTMRRPSRRRSTRRLGPKRKYRWDLNASTGVNLVGSNARTNFVLGNLLPEESRSGVTLTRILGELVIAAEDDGGPGWADNVSAIWYAGITVVHEDLQAANTLDPENDDADWLWYNTGYLSPANYENDAGNDLLHAIVPRYVHVDAKSKRRLRTREDDIVFVFKNDASSGFSLRIGLAARILWALP